MTEPLTAKCDIQIVKEPINVGDPFTLNCQGEFGQAFTSSVQTAFPDDANKYNLKILGVKSSSSSDAVFTVVSYKAGEFTNQGFILTDGVVTAKVEGLNWKVESVLEKDAKPFPPLGPISMRYPNAVWIALVLVLAIVGIIIWRIMSKRRARRELIQAVLGVGREDVPFRELIKIQNTQAYTQFSRDLRVIQKDMNAMKPKPTEEIWGDLEKAFRFYLVRELLTPAFNWSHRQILSDIKKNHRKVFNRSAVQLRRGLNEFDKGKGQKVTISDCEQMYTLVRQIADDIYETRRKVTR